jgi:hypothetical protein
MTNNVFAKLRRLGLFAVAGIALALSVHLTKGDEAATGPAAALIPVAIKVGAKFIGAASCSAADCHGSPTISPKKNENFWGNENTLWGGKDPHRGAYKTLVKPKSKEIAKALNIPSALKSDRCLNCHSTFIPEAHADLAGDKYAKAEGVSCNSCHGPYSKVLDPHKAAMWIDGERKKGDHDYLLNTWGIYDTLPIYFRTERCASCHLQIEPELVAAGHPQPTFEMNHFSRKDVYEDRHWNDPEGTFPAELWANGQLVEIHEALSQVALHGQSKLPNAQAEFLKAYTQSMSHFWAFYYGMVATKAVSGPDVDALVKAVGELGQVVNQREAAGAKAAAAAALCQSKGLIATVAAFKPDKATAAKLMAAVANCDLAKFFGAHGEEQQAYAIEAFAQAAGDAAVEGAVKALLPVKVAGYQYYTEAPKPEDFAKALTDVRAKVPH